MRKISITDNSGKAIAALLFWPETTCKYVLIICHGFRGSKDNSGNLAPFAERLKSKGIGVLAFDFFGGGESDGEFKGITLSRQAADLKRVIDYVYLNYRLPILLLGRSFGGTTVLAGGCSDERVSGYIFWSTPVFLRDTFSKSLKEYYHDLENGYEINITRGLDSFELAPEFVRDFDNHIMDNYILGLEEKPVLVVQGLDDDTVVTANAEYIDKLCRNSTLKLVRGADHRFTGKVIERDNLTIEWIKKYFNI